MKPTTLNSFLVAMKTELKEAEGKHPKFCDDLCDSEEAWDKVAEHYKRVNDTCEIYETNLLLYEEVSEALEAYSKKDYKHTLKELAQCGAVILRMMEFVKKQADAEYFNGYRFGH